MFRVSTNSYVMMHMHKWWLTMVNIETKHDALTNFFLITIIIWIGISEMKCLPHTNLIPTPIPLGLILILIPIPGFTKIHDSDTDSESSVSQKT